MSAALKANKAIVVANALLIGAALVMWAVIMQRGYHLTKLPIEAEGGVMLHTLPDEYPSWERAGPDQKMSAEGVEELGTANYLSRAYVQKDVPEGEPRHVVDLHLAYYTGMIDTVPHVPERCLVGAGLQQAGLPELVDVPLELDASDRDPTVAPAERRPEVVYKMRSLHTFNNERLPFGVEDLQIRVTPFVDGRGRRLYAGYFFVANGEAVPSAEDIRLRAFRLVDDYAYYCKIQFTSHTVESPAELADLVASMLGEMFPDIMRRLPDWVEVQDGRYPERDDAAS